MKRLRRMGDIRNAYKISVLKSVLNRQLGGPRHSPNEVIIFRLF
jgi:hypothetical protein